MIFRTAQMGLKQKLIEMIHVYGSSDKAWDIPSRGLPKTQLPQR